MAQQVVTGAQLTCNQGVAPSVLAVLPTSMVNANNVPAANIQDYIPMVNIMTFGM